MNANGVVQTHREQGGDAGGALDAALVAITGFGEAQMEGIRESLGGTHSARSDARPEAGVLHLRQHGRLEFVLGHPYRYGHSGPDGDQSTAADSVDWAFGRFGVWSP